MTASALAVVRAAVPNFRDAGGLPTPDGPMREGIVFRAAQLTRLDPATQRALRDLGVVTVADLRTQEEILHRPDTLPEGVDLLVLDVLADRPHSGAAEVAALVNQYEERASVAAINAAIGQGQAEQHMRDTYRHFVTLPSAHAGYRSLFRTIAVGVGASVIHCTAGKDRTGWAVAVLQLLAGAAIDDVVDDYLKSNDPMRATYRRMLDDFAAQGGDSDALSHMMLVYPEYLDTALTIVRAEFGDIPGYLERGLGMTPAEIAALRRRFV